MAVQTKTCEQCGKPMDTARVPKRRYCCRACYAASRCGRLGEDTRAVPCAYCGKEIVATFGRLSRSVSGSVYCNRECYAASMRTPVTREQLDYWYNELGQTLAQIADRLGIDLVTVHDLMEHFGLARRNKVEAAVVYPRRSFSGNRTDKAHLIGFRLGDLNVRMDLPTSKTIQVRCGTTIPAQVELIQRLFESYGHVNTRRGSIGETQVECHLDMSFEFLLPKEDRVPDWVMADNECFWAFLAGYMDAESYIGLRKAKTGRSAIVEIASCDIGVLGGLLTGLRDRGVAGPDLYLKNRAGTIDRRGIRNNRDFYILRIMRKASLDRMFQGISPFLKHGDKQVAMAEAWANIRERGLP